MLEWGHQTHRRPEGVENGAVHSDPFAFPAFVISIAAALTALGALAWSIVAWAWNGPWVRLRVHSRVEDDGQHVSAYVWNRGRMASDIIHVEVFRADDPHPVLIPVLGVDRMPYRLEPYSSVTFEDTYDRRGTFFGARWYGVRVYLANGDIKKARSRPRRLFR